MKHFQGTQQVEPGIYMNTHGLNIESQSEAGPLPGSESERYYRIPPVALLIVGPVLGLVYAIFLPFVGFVMLGKLIVGKTAELALDATRASLRVLRPSWQPSMAFLSRSKHRKDEKPQDDSWSREAEARIADEEDHKEEAN